MSERWFGLDDVLSGHARGRPEDVALVCAGHRLSWREVEHRVDALTAALAARGLGPGDRLLWLGQNCHRMLEALFAAARLGAVLCPANWRQSEPELRFVLDDAEPAVVLWQREEIGARVEGLRTGSTAEWIGHDDPGPGGYESFLARYGATSGVEFYDAAGSPVKTITGQQHCVERDNVECYSVEQREVEFFEVPSDDVGSTGVEPGDVKPSDVELTKVESNYVELADVETRSVEASGLESADVEHPAVEHPAVEHKNVERPNPGEPVLMLYTAAFDGRPNGALLSSTALLAQTTTLRLLEGIGADEVFLNSGPLFHIGTLRRTLAVAHAGGCNVMLRRVDPESVARLVAEEGCTSAFLMRPTMEQIVDTGAGARYDLSSLRTPPGPPGWDDLVDVQRGPRVRSGYGQTELAGVVTFGLPDRPGTGAWPGPLAAVEILDPAGAPVPPGEVGEIAVRGPMVTNGYHRRPELTAARRRFGWWHTGDLGRRELDGSVSFVGPLLRMIKSAAENVYPAEVEAALRAHAGVAAAAVIGVPDPTWGQRVLAVVVPATGVEPGPDLVTELDGHCRRQLAGYKRPRRVEFVDALPTAGGTTDYAALDDRFGGGNYPGTHTGR